MSRSNRFFLGTFPPEFENVLLNCTVACVSIEVTAATRHSEASRLHKETFIGGVPWKTYRAMNIGVVLRSKPRIRSVSISVPYSRSMALRLGLVASSREGAVADDAFLRASNCWLRPVYAPFLALCRNCGEAQRRLGHDVARSAPSAKTFVSPVRLGCLEQR